MIDCSQCQKKGCCCGIVPISKEVAKETENLAQVKPEKVVEIEGKLYIITEDGLCVYLNRKTKECMIYDKRPMICRDYGLIDALPCPYFRKDGTKRGFTERKIVEMTINKTVDDAIRRLK